MNNSPASASAPAGWLMPRLAHARAQAVAETYTAITVAAVPLFALSWRMCHF